MHLPQEIHFALLLSSPLHLFIKSGSRKNGLDNEKYSILVLFNISFIKSSDLLPPTKMILINYTSKMWLIISAVPAAI